MAMLSDEDLRRHRLERALLSQIRQEFSAPLAAIQGFTEIVAEEAARHGFDDYLADLARIREAGAQLQALIGTLLEPGARAVEPAAEAGTAAAFEAWRIRLRHDLRTPINAIKGYGELLAEEARESERWMLVGDLERLIEAAAALLRQIDALVTFSDRGLSDRGSSARGGPGEQAAMASAAARSARLVSTALDAIRPVAPEQDAADAPPSRILVVDDNPSNRDLLSRRLLRDGHEVAVAESGRAALDCVAANAFDLILLDLMMPEISGIEVLRRLKRDPRHHHIPVIMISALDEIDSIVRCVEAGAEDYLPKPFNTTLLRARIGAALEKKRLRDRERAVLEELRVEKDKSEALLLNILPWRIAERMRRGEKAIADRFDEVTILFADIVGFTGLAATLPPSRVVELLNSVFTGFDDASRALGLEKIKTIGDSYMLAGGVPEPLAEHAAACAEMALRMLDIVREAGAAFGHALDIRIGMHTGTAVAGIIGTHRFLYDVWGDTVNTASRMESHGIAGRIQISAATRRRIEHRFSCLPRGPLEIKGKGRMETWFVVARRP